MSKPLDQREFVPALRFNWATKRYDTAMGRTMREHMLRERSIDLLTKYSGGRVLDLGCGTGTLTQAITQSGQFETVVGYDIDPAALQIALEKERDQANPLKSILKQVDVTDVSSIPNEDLGSFDVVVSSLLFHHLSPSQKSAALDVVKSSLVKGGHFVLIDWGPGQNLLLKMAFNLVRLLDGFEVTRQNARGELPNLLNDASFKNVTAQPLLNTMFGTVWAYEAKRS